MVKLSGTRIAIADLVDYYGRGKIITRINVPAEFRGKGHGTALLKQIIEDADREKIALYLEIQSSDGLSYDELEAWYKRHGFKNWEGSGIYRRTTEEKANGAEVAGRHAR